MPRYHSAPGGHWLVAAAEGRILALRGSDDAIERAWSTVSVPVQAVLDELTSSGLSATPSFAFVEFSGEFATGTATAHCIVRGDVRVSIVAGGESIEIDGQAATTWAERTIEGVQSLDLVFGVDAPATAALPLEHGVVWADRVTLAQEGAGAAPLAAVTPRAAASTPAPVTPTPVAPSTAAAAPKPVLVAPPVTPIVAPQSTDIEEATIAEFTLSSSRSAVAIDDEPAKAENSFGYDSLFEETMVRSIEDAAVRPEEEGDEGSLAADGSQGDHDGMTMMGEDFAALRAARKKGVKAALAPVEKAPSYCLELSSGGTEPLASTVLVGRAPSVSKISGGQIPRLVTLTGSDDISRNHAQFSVEGDTVVVTDLHSRNGTSIILPGRSPQLLRAGEPTSVLVDTVVDLGGGVTLTVRED